MKRTEENRAKKLVKRNKRRKARHAFQSAVIMSFLLFCAAFAGLKAGAIRTNAQNANPEGSVKQYKSVMVERDDCLWDIADRYMGRGYADKRVYIDEVKDINCLSGDELQYGSYLCVPYYE